MEPKNRVNRPKKTAYPTACEISGLKGVLLRSAAEPANTPIVEQARVITKPPKKAAPIKRNLEKEPLKPLQKYGAYVTIFH
jgi:hypothetical protein